MKTKIYKCGHSSKSIFWDVTEEYLFNWFIWKLTIWFKKTNSCFDCYIKRLRFKDD